MLNNKWTSKTVCCFTLDWIYQSCFEMFCFCSLLHSLQLTRQIRWMTFQTISWQKIYLSYTCYSLLLASVPFIPAPKYESIQGLFKKTSHRKNQLHSNLVSKHLSFNVKYLILLYPVSLSFLQNQKCPTVSSPSSTPTATTSAAGRY